MKNYEWDRRLATGGNRSWQRVAALCMPRYRKTVYFYQDPEQLILQKEDDGDKPPSLFYSMGQVETPGRQRKRMTLDAHMWGNPETVLQRKQEAEARKHANCGSCVHHQSMQVSSGVIHICDLKRQKYGYRCINFKIKKVKL